MKKDIVLMTVPLLELKCPVTGPYILKAQIESQGFKCKVYDFNVWLWHELGVLAPELWDFNGDIFGIEEKLNEYANIINPVIEKYVAHVLEHDDPDWIGATQFAWTSNYITKWIFNEFKRQGYKGKTVLGGPNCMEWGPHHHMYEFADHTIYGEGEESLVELLRGNTKFPGIDTKMFKQLQNLDAYPIPDYSDVEWHKYPVMHSDLYHPDAWRNQDDGLRQLYITGSRGCVRQCTFCDIHAMAPKFKFRSGKSIAEEVVSHYEKWGVTFYNFTDSLINGSVKAFEDFLTSIIEYKEKKLIPEEVQFWGQAIARPKRQHPEEHFEMMSKAGIFSMSIGIESGSERVRDHMKKKFTNEDIDWTYEMAQKHGIKISTLMLVGYPTETEEDFQETLDMFTRHKDKAGQAIPSIAIGPTMAILPNAPIAQSISEMGIHSDVNGDWILDENDLETRLDRWFRLREHLLSNGFSVFPDRHSNVLREYKEKLVEIKQGKRAPNEKSYVEIFGYENVVKQNETNS